MLEKGINTEDIFANLYTKELKSYQLQAYVYKHIKLSENGVAYMFMTKKIMKKFNVSIEDASNMVNLMDGIRGSMIWALFIEHPKEIRVRLRSRHVKIIDVAKMYNGGGHDNASGATIYNKKQIKNVIEDCDKLLKAYKIENEDKF
jgi:phosphoesterase RecJ-like protein